MSTAFQRIGEAAWRLFGASESVALRVGPEGPQGEIRVPSDGDGRWEIGTEAGRSYLTPDDSSYYLYFVLPDAFRASATPALWIEVEYLGDSFGQFRLQYASSDPSEPHAGLYKAAEQRFSGDALGLRRVRRALFRLGDFDSSRTQNHGASFRFEFRRELRVVSLRASTSPPPDATAFDRIAPVPELKKMPGRFYPINYLFLEITNACNFKCSWCPDDIMDRRRGFMAKQDAFKVFDEIAEKRSRIGPLYPVKLHQMGEPMLHPDLAEMVAHAESRDVPIELNTNCGLITEEKINALYRAGLTNLILSYQTPDIESFKTRKAPRIAFAEYRDKVRLAVERKAATGASTRIEIDIMNTKHADGVRIVSEDDQAVAFLEDWIGFCQSLETKYGLQPRLHDLAALRAKRYLDQDENGSRYELLDGVTLIWKRVHSWGNVIGDHQVTAIPDTYCPAPYDQFVIHWNGDVVACCTDYEGRTKHANVFAESIESVWMGDLLKRRKRDMLEGRLLDVCAKCIGVK